MGKFIFFGIIIFIILMMFAHSADKKHRGEFEKKLAMENAKGRAKIEFEKIKHVINPTPQQRKAALDYLKNWGNTMKKSEYYLAMARFAENETDRKEYQQQAESWLRIELENGKFNHDLAVALVTAEGEKRRKEAQRKEDTKTIIGNAAVGGIVAGPAGAVVGAIVGKNKADSKK